MSNKSNNNLMATVELDCENAKHIAILNDEMGKVQVGIADFKLSNAVEHEKINSSIASFGRDVKEIREGQSKLGWGLVASVIILIIGMVVTNIIK